MLPASSASAAATPVTKSLPITSLYQVAVDNAHSHLFFSEGRAPGSFTTAVNSILVTDLSGNTVTSINGMTGVAGIALSPDSSTLYAALSSANEIIAISTSTLKVTATYSTDSYDPYTLAFEDGLLWIGYGPSGATSSGIGYINPATATPTFVPSVLNNGWTWPPYLSADPSNASSASTTGTIVASEDGTSPTPVASFKISRSTVKSTDSANLSNVNPARLNVLPGGSQVLIDGSLYDTTNIAAGSQGAYPVSGDSATAIAPNGWTAFGYGLGQATWDAGITTFPPGSTTADPAQGYSGFGDAASYVAAMTWSADSSELFAAITRDNSSGAVTGYSLQTLYPPTPFLQPFPLSLSTSASTTRYKGTVNVSVEMGLNHDSTSYQSVRVYETPAGGKATLIKTVSLGSGSGYTFPTGQLATRTTFTASVSGDSQYGAVTTPAKTVNVYASVWAALGNYYRSATAGGDTYRFFHRTTSLKDSTAVTPSKHGECVKLEYQRGTSSGWKAWTSTRCYYLNSYSRATITAGLGGETVGSKYRVRVDYVRSSTDTANLSAQSGWQYFIVER